MREESGACQGIDNKEDDNHRMIMVLVLSLS